MKQTFKDTLATHANPANKLLDDVQRLGTLFNTRRYAEMERVARQLTRRQPAQGMFWKALGTTLAIQGRASEAVTALRKASALLPSDAETQCNLGMILLDLHQVDAAEECFRNLVARDPHNAAAHDNLGAALKARGLLDDAESCYRRALNIDPHLANAHGNLGNLLQANGRPAEAEFCFRKVLSRQPRSSQALVCLGTALLAQARLAEATACFRQAADIAPDDEKIRSTLLFTLGYDPELPHANRLQEARRYGRLVTQKATHPFTTWHCTPRPERLRVGIVSGDLHTHPVGYFLEGLLAHIDPRRTELVAYPTSSKSDPLTERIRSGFSAWKPIAGQDDAAAARMIHADGNHVLVDLSGHTSGNRLPVFAWKPAPVQVSWLGYVATTGLEQMDYVLADPTGAPAFVDDQFVESVWRLPDARVCFSAPQIDLPVGMSPALRNGHVNFSCFQNLAKVSDAVMACWREILAQLPDAHLYMQCRELGITEVRQRVLRRLQQHRIDPGRVFMQKSVRREEYFAGYSDIDIALDTFPYPGTTTTCEALWMGVPTVTLAGTSLLAREGASLMTAAGLPEYVAASEAEYIAKAVALARDTASLARLRGELRQRAAASPVFNAKRFARNLENAFFEMWRRHEGFPQTGLATLQSSQPGQFVLSGSQA